MEWDRAFHVHRVVGDESHATYHDKVTGFRGEGTVEEVVALAQAACDEGRMIEGAAELVERLRVAPTA